MNHIKKRVLQEATYFIQNKSTVRETATHFGLSKTTIYQDLRDRCSDFYPALYIKVSALLASNKKEAAYRGGMATKKKYTKLQSAKKQ